jgi:hypothetical protein
LSHLGGADYCAHLYWRVLAGKRVSVASKSFGLKRQTGKSKKQAQKCLGNILKLQSMTPENGLGCGGRLPIRQQALSVRREWWNTLAGHSSASDRRLSLHHDLIFDVQRAICNLYF